MERKDRVCEDFLVYADDHACLDANWHLNMSVVAAFGRMVRKHFAEHPLNKFIPVSQRPKVWSVDPGCLHFGTDVMLALFIDVSCLNCFLNCLNSIQGDGNFIQERFQQDAWLFPFFSTVRHRWMLGIVDWRRRKFWYSDSRPWSSTDQTQEGNWCIWKVLNATIGFPFA